MKLDDLEKQVYECIVRRIDRIKATNKIQAYQNELQVVSWWIAGDCSITTRKANQVCDKLIKKGLIKRNPIVLNKSYGVSYILNN